jgi:hypothetical protein
MLLGPLTPSCWILFFRKSSQTCSSPDKKTELTARSTTVPDMEWAWSPGHEVMETQYACSLATLPASATVETRVLGAGHETEHSVCGLTYGSGGYRVYRSVSWALRALPQLHRPKALHTNTNYVIPRALLREIFKQNFKVKCESSGTKDITWQ